MVKNYSKDEIWAAAKFIWENTPEITDLEMVDQLHVAYGDAAPKSGGTISKRRRKESWTKINPVKQVKGSTKTGSTRDGIATKRNQKSRNSNSIPSKTNKAQNSELDAELESAGLKISEITESVVIDAQGRAAIINKTRRRYANLGKLFDQALGITLSIVDLADEAERLEQESLAGNYGADFEIGENEDSESDAANEAEFAVEKLKRALMLSKSLSDTTTSLAIAVKTISEVELPLCGITPEDFKQSDQERRLGALEALGDIHIEEQEARERLEAELNDRLEWIKETANSGDFGRTPEPDVGDVEDIDYTAVDD